MRSPTYTPVRRRAIRQRRTRQAIFFLIAVALVGATVGWLNRDEPKDSTASATATTKTVANNKSSPSPNTSRRAASVPKQAHPATSSAAAIKTALQKVIDAHPELEISISFNNLKTNDQIAINADRVYSAASSTKMITALTFLSQVEAGTHSLTEELGDYTTQEQLQLMVNQSNNDSWAFFNDMLGFPAQEEYAKSIDVTSYVSSENSLSASDMTNLLSLLYKGKLLNAADTKLLLSYMVDTVDEELIPAALPTSATVYHKYGALEDNVHDSGIVVEGDQSYVISIFTNGKGYYNYDQRATTFAELMDAIEANL